MRQFIFLALILSLSISLQAQYGQKQYANVARETGDKAIEDIKKTFPKFYREFHSLKAKDSLINEINYIRERGVGPAFASPKGVIKINLEYLGKRKPNYDDNRLIVVLYHELGHLHYFAKTERSKWNPEDSEKAAFEYSLLKTKELAVHGDCAPLATGLKFMKLRSEGENLKDAHVRALKRMVKEPLYADYIEYIAGHCKP